MNGCEFFDDGLLNEVVVCNLGVVDEGALLKNVEGSFVVLAAPSAQPRLWVPCFAVRQVASRLQVRPQPVGPNFIPVPQKLGLRPKPPATQGIPKKGEEALVAIL